MKAPEIVKLDTYLSPYSQVIESRMLKYQKKKIELTAKAGLSSFATGHLYFGLHFINGEWIFREWAPNASNIFLIGDFNGWKESEDFKFKSIGNGNWELHLEKSLIKHKDLYKLSVHWEGGSGERIPAYSTRAVQDDKTKLFSSQVWFPDTEFLWKNPSPKKNIPPLVYEAHIGMATEEQKVGSYKEFREHVLPKIIKAGYNTIQLMAIQEHPYYGSFGYHVSSLFAASSRFGEPEELKMLIDEAHGAGIRVIMDLVHSHAVKNENEGLGLYDGSPYQFFHTGIKREHVAWDSLCYNYAKNEVLHFLLSNLQYWQKVYHFDGFRFDGVTSMLYLDHGLGRDFTNYSMYFDDQQDEDAITYLALANDLIHENNPNAITVAEEMSGYPGLAAKLADGGIGFDYRMAMGIPDYWIKIIKEKPDEQWNVAEMYYELTNKRIEEKTIGYAESHDQALVGDQTIIFRLIGKDMYDKMDKAKQNLSVERGIALHKMIRLVTATTSGNGYLNFMGNEFGHPEWIDFPRLGNNWSYQYARRQWSLIDKPGLTYNSLNEFDKKMIALINEHRLLEMGGARLFHDNTEAQVLGYERGDLYFIFNFSPEHSYTDYGLNASPAKYKVVLDTDELAFNGQGRIDHNYVYRTMRSGGIGSSHYFKIYLPSRTALVLKREKIKGVFDTP